MNLGKEEFMEFGHLGARRLRVDLSMDIPKRWAGGDAFKTAFFNALSMSFPVGEQYFIDSLKTGVELLAPEQAQRWAPLVKGFVAQEATHRRVHGLFNDKLRQQGFSNLIEKIALDRISQNKGRDPKIHVAATAATEHFTAIFADWLLGNPWQLDGSPEHVKAMWLWHSAEESEHRQVAHGLYAQLGGSEKWRVRVFEYVTWIFFLDVARQTIANLWTDKALFHWSTFKSARKMLWGQGGLIVCAKPLWRMYLDPKFDPSWLDAGLSEAWLAKNPQWVEAI